MPHGPYLYKVSRVKGKLICIALPIMVNRVGKTEQLSEEISSLVQKLGYRLLESHGVYVHRSLTREVIVYQKE